MTDSRFRICRDALIRQIQEKSGLPVQGTRLPETFETILKGVQILGDNPREPIPGLYDVIVKKGNRGRFIRHRIFVFCEKCRRDIPTGRLHQHRAFCKV